MHLLLLAITGVPFLYCFQSFYLLKNQRTLHDGLPYWFVTFLYVLLVISYYIFDTANAQKADYKMPGLKRNTFPQLPWRSMPDPVRCIKTPKGDLLVDGTSLDDIFLGTSCHVMCPVLFFKHDVTRDKYSVICLHRRLTIPHVTYVISFFL